MSGGRRLGRIANRVLAPAALIAAASMTGCEVDDWLINPGTVGRWQHTPTIVPVLERIDIIESDTGDYVDPTQVTAQDLIPEPRDYQVSAGDVLRVQVLDLLPGGSPLRDDYVVDQRGYINIPLIEPVFVADMTAQDVQRAIADTIIKADILDSPQVNVLVVGQRQATVSVFGAIAGVGRYQIPNPEYRLLDALTDAGGLSPIIPKVFIIRQVPLTDEVQRGNRPSNESGGTRRNDKPADSGEDLINLIDKLTAPEPSPGNPTPAPSPAPKSAPGASPGVVGLGAMRDPDAPSASRANWPTMEDVTPVAAMQDGGEPIIDLLDDSAATPMATTQVAPVSMAEPISTMVSSPTARWVFLDGEWVKVMRASPSTNLAPIPEGADPLAGSGGKGSVGELVTQRVIEVPTVPLLQGLAQYNIIIRPGDVINVPSPEQGNVYVGGPGISRPGTYNLPFAGRLTIQRLIFAAGGLSQISDPNKVDITRMVGTDRQATVRLSVKAIYEGTQPDIFIKPDDLLNFGTNFWMLPLAVIRGGFRATYGFGFLMDRNFGNDVFGAPPENFR